VVPSTHRDTEEDARALERVRGQKPSHLYTAGLSATLGSAAVPYGYTLTVWATGSLLMERHNLSGMTVTNIALFVAGAASGYGLLRVATARTAAPHEPQGISRTRVIRSGGVHLLGIATGVALAGVAARLGSGAWFVAPFVATLAYLAITALNEALTLVERSSEDR
jgi:hypothetical protein